MAQVALEPGAMPPKDKLIPIKGKDGIWRLTRIRHRAYSGEYIKTSAVGRTRRECLDEWERNFKKNVLKGSKRKRISRRKQFSPTDKMSKVFAELDAQYKAKVAAGKMSEGTYTNYRCYIYPPAKDPTRSKNPDAFKLDTEMGSLSITEAADAAWIADYLDEVADSAYSTAYHQHRQLCSAFKVAVLGKGIEPNANPMPYVPRPTGDRAEPRPLSPEEQRGVLQRIDTWLNDGRGESHYLHILYLLLLGTGIRPGEGLAVRWCDITEEEFDGVIRSVLYVGATVRCKSATGPYRNPRRKSGNEYRVVLPDWLREVLAAEKLRVSPASDELPVLQGPRSSAGSWVSVTNARMAVCGMRNGSQFDTFRLSDLRDTVATHIAMGDRRRRTGRHPAWAHGRRQVDGSAPLQPPGHSPHGGRGQRRRAGIAESVQSGTLRPNRQSPTR